MGVDYKLHNLSDGDVGFPPAGLKRIKEDFIRFSPKLSTYQATAINCELRLGGVQYTVIAGDTMYERIQR